jgi:hypothetical protein
MDQFTRRIIGFGVHGGIIDGVALCRMFQRDFASTACPNTISRAQPAQIPQLGS